MQNGSKDSSQDDSLEARVRSLRAGVAEAHFIEMRGRPIPVRILTLDEMSKIRRDSISNAMIMKGDDTDQKILAEKYTLMMCTRMNKNEPSFLSDKLLELLTLDEIAHLYTEYMVVLDKVNPSLEDISEQEFKILVDAVKKKHVGWKDFSIKQLRAIFNDWERLIQTPEEQSTPLDS